ncbi:MAG TPA: DUF559 domain-containing protein, partial [Dehalococcoidia bacterium]|nr:DUF559 domain-containing protein [Dehalococcoidia bacterium]
DGSHHFDPDQARLDEVRTKWLIERGLRVLRFDNRQVMTELEAVLERILEEVTVRPHPNPLPRGEGADDVVDDDVVEE